MTDVIVTGETVDVTVEPATLTEVTVLAPAVVNHVVSAVQGISYAKGDPIYSKVRNMTGSTLAKGTVVYTSGANGDNVQVTKAIATGDFTSARTMGFVDAPINHGEDGYVVIAGYLTGIDTENYTIGSIIYLSPTVAGGFTQTKPVAPNHMVYLGVITRVNKNNGSIYVHPQNGYELDELHNVKITNPQDGDVLTYQASTGLWINA